MAAKLADAELTLLSTAMTRDDTCVLLPTNLRGARFRKTGERLIELGLVREVRAKPSSPVWRRDDEGDPSHSLKLTAAGMKAAKEFEAAAAQSEPSKRRKSVARSAGVARSAAATSPQPGIAAPRFAPPQTPPEPPRSGSKIAGVIALLERETGASILDLIAATGWLPHTTRAALTGLRKRGYKIALDRSERKRDSIYRIESESTAPEPRPADGVAEAP